MLLDETTSLLQRYCIEINPAVDEHQLVDAGTIKALVDAVEIHPQDTVLEIGPGAGNITVELANHAQRLIAVEKNPKYLPILRDRLQNYRNFELIEADALKIFFPQFNKMVSNLPYAIAETILQKLFRVRFDAASLLLPLTLAKTIAATKDSKTYSKLTYMTRLFTNIDFFKEVASDVYFPKPNTSTALVLIKSRWCKEPHEIAMRNLILQGDKKVRNALCETIISLSVHGFPNTKKKAKELILTSGFQNSVLHKRISRLTLGELEIIEAFFIAEMAK